MVICPKHKVSAPGQAEASCAGGAPQHQPPAPSCWQPLPAETAPSAGTTSVHPTSSSRHLWSTACCPQDSLTPPRPAATPNEGGFQHSALLPTAAWQGQSRSQGRSRLARLLSALPCPSKSCPCQRVWLLAAPAACGLGTSRARGCLWLQAVSSPV